MKYKNVVRVVSAVSAAVIAFTAPVVAAAQSSTPEGSGQVQQEQPAADPLLEQAQKFYDEGAAQKADSDAVVAAADAATDVAAATAAKDSAEKIVAAAADLRKRIQAFLDGPADGATTEVRIKAGQGLALSDEAATNAGKAIAVAQEKIDAQPEPEPEPGVENLIVLEKTTVKRGDSLGVAVFCAEGEGGGFRSDVIDFLPETAFNEDQVWAIGGIVKADASPGAHTVSAHCGDETLTATFQVDAAAAPQGTVKPKITKDDVRRKVVVRPTGRVETGGGATSVA